MDNLVSTIYVCNLMGDMLYPLDEIDKSSVSLTELLNGQWELSFTYTKSKDVYSPAYEALEEGMYLYLEDKAHFKMRQPAVRIDAATETKEITAYSCEVELEDKVVTFPVNMGEKTSLEYLLNDGKQGLPYTWHEDPDDASSIAHESVELLCDPYTTRPYDWIVLYNTYEEQLKQFLDWYRAQTLDVDGSLTIMQETNEWAFKYCKLVLNQIPRLISRAEDINPDHDGDGIADVVTVEDLLDVSTVDYRFIQYAMEVRPDDDESSEVIGYRLGPVVDKNGEPIVGESFENRILMLIGFYQTYGKQLSLLDIMCAQTNYTWVAGDVYGLSADGFVFTAEHPEVTEAICDAIQHKFEVANSRMQFDIDETIYSFWTSTYAQRTNRLVTFDRLARRINITPVEFVGNDTGIAFDYDQLLNTLNISTNEDTLATRITVHGADDLSIEQVNFGEDYVVDLDYKLNARGTDGRRLYVSDTLAEKYDRYLEYRAEKREEYREKSIERNALNAEIYELKYRLPADSMHEDWDSYSDAEIEGALKEYSNKLNALQQLYGTDYGFHSIPRNAQDTELPPWVQLSQIDQETLPKWRRGCIGEDETVIPRTERIQRTMYWWDYVAYCQTLTQIYIAMQARHLASCSNRYSNITEESDNPDIRKKYQYITAWETEWSLYGTIELGNKVAAYDNQLQVMIDGDAVEVKHIAWEDLATKPFKPVESTAGQNPSTSKWLELVDGQYVVTTDTSPVGGKTYYLSLQQCFADQTGASFDDACEIIEKKKAWGNLQPEDKMYFDSVEENYLALLDASIVYKEAIPWSELTDAQRQKHGNIEVGYYYDDYVAIFNNRISAQSYLDELMRDQLLPKETRLAEVQSERDQIAACARLATYENPDSHERFTDYELQVLNLLMRDSDYTNEYILITSLNDTVNALEKMEELYQDATNKVRLFSRPQLVFAVEVDNMLALPEFEAWHGQFTLGNYMYVEYRDGTHTRVRMIGRTYNPCMVSGDLTVQFSNLMYTKNEVSDVENVLGLAQPTTSSGGSGGSGGGSGGGATFEDLLARISQSMLERLLSPEGFVKEVSDVVANKVVRRQLTTKEQMYRSLAEGLADVDGGCLSTGLIRSSATTTHTDEYNNVILDDDGTPKQFPISWLDLDDGTFNFADGKLMFVKDGEIDGHVYGHLEIEGEVNATAGLIGGVKLGWIDIDHYSNELVNRLCFNRTGMSFLEPYYIQVANPSGYNPANEKWVVLQDGKYEYALETTPRPGVTYYKVYWKTFFGLQEFPDGWQLELSKLYMPGDPTYNGIYPVYSDGVSIGTSFLHGSRYANSSIEEHQTGYHTLVGSVDIDFAAGTIRATGQIRGGSIASDGAISGASVSATNGNITTTNGTVSGKTVSAGTGGISNGGGYSGTGHLYVQGANTTSASGSSTYRYIAVGPSAPNYAPTGNYTGAVMFSNGYIRGSQFFGSGSNLTGVSHSNGSDYAECFEWLDGNINNDDRRGRFVTTDGDKIRLATHEDDYLLGIITGTPTILAHTAWDSWHDKYLRDEFGAIITEQVEHQAVTDNNGNIIEDAYVAYEPVVNPEYDETREYIPRTERKEWAPVGLVGQLIMLDDGTCEVNGFATSADEGIATKADGITSYRVIKRIDDHHIMVAAK